MTVLPVSFAITTTGFPFGPMKLKTLDGTGTLWGIAMGVPRLIVGGIAVNPETELVPWFKMNPWRWAGLIAIPAGVESAPRNWTAESNGIGAIRSDPKSVSMNT